MITVLGPDSYRDWNFFILFNLKKITYILFFFFLGNAFSQKTIKREFNAFEITTIEINSDIIYHINITSEKTNQIKINTQIEGENYENVVLSILEENETLKINTPYTPFFKVKNDKLAAHKLISIEMELIVPETIKIQIVAAISSLTTLGEFKELSADLEGGNCILNNFKGNALLKTKQGFITVYANKEIFGTAISKKGIVINELSNPKDKRKKNNTSKHLVEAESFSGNISLFQIH